MLLITHLNWPPLFHLTQNGITLLQTWSLCYFLVADFLICCFFAYFSPPSFFLVCHASENESWCYGRCWVILGIKSDCKLLDSSGELHWSVSQEGARLKISHTKWVLRRQTLALHCPFLFGLSYFDNHPFVSMSYGRATDYARVLINELCRSGNQITSDLGLGLKAFIHFYHIRVAHLLFS